MSDNANKTENQSQANNSLQIDVPPTLDTKYRDIFNLHITPEELVIEFGNLQRHVPGRAIVHERIVLSPSNAIRLQQWLTNALQTMQQKIREAAAAQAEKKPE